MSSVSLFCNSSLLFYQYNKKSSQRISFLLSWTYHKSHIGALKHSQFLSSILLLTACATFSRFSFIAKKTSKSWSRVELLKKSHKSLAIDDGLLSFFFSPQLSTKCTQLNAMHCSSRWLDAIFAVGDLLTATPKMSRARRRQWQQLGLLSYQFSMFIHHQTLPFCLSIWESMSSKWVQTIQKWAAKNVHTAMRRTKKEWNLNL